MVGLKRLTIFNNYRLPFRVRSSAQRNLLFEYQREARISFEDMEKSIKKAMIRNILLGEVSFGKDNEMIILYP